ncbi:MAG: S8 family serine peptidase [Phycisphaerales bacterium]
MAKRSSPRSMSNADFKTARVGASPDEMLLAASDRGSESLETGRYLITFPEGDAEAGLQALQDQKFKVADARDFSGQSFTLEDVGDAEALVLPEIGVALVGADGAEAHGLHSMNAESMPEAMGSMDPEYFMFAEGSDYLRGFLSAANTIARDLGTAVEAEEGDVEAEVLGATWGLTACKVPPSKFSGKGIKVAVLDTGFDLKHPDFAGRPVTAQTFVGQPVQDLNGHGTHCTGTAEGTRAPAGSTPRYGIAYASRIFIGKVLTNAGNGTMAGVLAGMNWAIANKCEVISMSLGAQIAPQPSYTNAGNAALRSGLLIIAAAGNAAAATGAPANSPSIMSVASLDPRLNPSSFSNFGKIEIAAPGRDVFSSWPMPVRYKTISGTSMACPHVAGCAALWAQSNVRLRGQALWRQLQASARSLPYPLSRVGAGLVQAP